MNETPQSSKLTAGEQLTAKLLAYAPWLAFFLFALLPPLYFLSQYFTAPAADMAVYMLLTLVSFAGGALAGLLVALVILLYRRAWEKRVRERLASDGVTADELSWFMRELKPAERRALKQIESQNLLLADAYRETLAARITAARVLTSTRRETLAVERRLHSASQLRGEGRAALENDLRTDRERLARMTREASEHQAEIETRLQRIEAMAGRSASDTETRQALLRLGSIREYQPLALTQAQLEHDTRTQVEREMRESKRPF
jgi:hypothetical protein